MKLYTLVLCLMFAFVLNKVYSQDMKQARIWNDSLRLAKDDTSRINALRKIGLLYQSSIPDSSIFYTQQALALSEKINWTKGIAQNCLNLGNYFMYVSKYDSGIYFETKALQAAKIVGDKNRIALIYINRGAAYTETQQYERAMPDLMQAMHLAKEMGNKDREARALQGICELYIYQENYNASLPWGEKALQLANELGNEEFQGIAEMSLGGIYFKKNDFKKSEKILLDAISKLRAAQRTDVVMSAAITLSDIYNTTHSYQQALNVLNKAITEGRYTNEIDQISALYNSLGDTYFNTEQFADANIAYKKGYELVKGKTEFQQRQYGNLYGMSKTYARLDDFKNAYALSQQASLLKDSVTQKAQNEKLLKLQTQFETKTKEEEIVLLKKDKELSYASLQKQKTFQYAAYIIFLLLLTIGFLIINRYRTVQRAKRILEMEQMRNNIARNLHDDIGSTLTSINILSKVALQQTEIGSTAKTNMQKIKERSAEIMESMNDIVWAINPANDALDKIILRMKEFGAETCEQAGMQFMFEEDDSLNDIKLSLAQRNNLFLIYKEALNNAVKYSAAKTINTFLKKEQHQLILKIEDDGMGFNSEKKFTGNGLKNMQSRAGDMHAVLRLESQPGNGTIINLTIPIP